jgi:hypothetical protein
MQGKPGEIVHEERFATDETLMESAGYLPTA